MEWAIPLEFCLKPDAAMLGRLLVYMGNIWLEKRPTDAGKERFHLGAILINLTGEGAISREMHFPKTDMRLHLGVTERNLETFDPVATLAQIASGELPRSVLPWIGLMRGADKPGILVEWKRAASAEPDHRRRGDYGGLALVFAEAAGQRDAWKKALKEWNVIESQQVVEWMAQGEVRGATRSLLLMLTDRFGIISDDLSAAIRSTNDIPRFDAWLLLAARVPTLEAFREQAGI